MDGIIFDIQYYAMYDGPGIRTTVFLKGCPLRCSWCHNPESMKKNPEMAYTADRCEGCGVCAEVCTENALTLVDDCVVRDQEKCTVCGECANVCPAGAMEKIGELLSSEEVAERVLRDREFYETSGGGVTFTGGEPTLQFDFLLEALGKLKAAGIHTAIETCGLFKGELINQLAEKIDLFLIDLKFIDNDLHKEWTKVSNKRILLNFKALVTKVGSENIFARLPLIPGVNADESSIEQVIGFLQDANYTGIVHLMPYNRLAKTKWKKIGRGDEYRDFGVLSEEWVERIEKQLQASGFEVVVNE